MYEITIKESTAVGTALTKLAEATNLDREVLGSALISAALTNALTETAEQAPTESNKAKAQAIA